MKNKERTIYHIALPHDPEIWAVFGPTILRFFPKIKAIFLECASSNAMKISAVERYCNEFARGFSPFLMQSPQSPEEYIWHKILDLIWNSQKKIYLERAPRGCDRIRENIIRTHKEIEELFFQKKYKEAGISILKRTSLISSWAQLRDIQINRDLRDIIKDGNVLVILGPSHEITCRDARVIQWEPVRRDFLVLNQRWLSEDLTDEDLRNMALENQIGDYIALFLRSCGKGWVESLERARRIIKKVSSPELKEMADFIVSGPKRKAVIRTISWLKRKKRNLMVSLLFLGKKSFFTYLI